MTNLSSSNVSPSELLSDTNLSIRTFACEPFLYESPPKRTSAYTTEHYTNDFFSLRTSYLRTITYTSFFFYELQTLRTLARSTAEVFPHGLSSLSVVKNFQKLSWKILVCVVLESSWTIWVPNIDGFP